MFLHHYLLMASFDAASVKEQVLKICKMSEANDWESAVSKLRKYLSWEFEGYQGENA